MRIFFSRLGAAVLAAALVPLPAEATTMEADHLVVFGDSLSDNRWAHELSGGRIPRSPPYAPKRFANGKIWVDHAERAFEARGGTVQNYAVGGSTSVLFTQGQIAAFALDGRRPPNMAAVLASVHNDLEFIAMNRRSGTLGRRVADRATRLVAQSVKLNAHALSELGISKFAIFNAVDIGNLPLYANDPRRAAYATRAARIYNAALEPILRSLEEDGHEVVKVDIAGLFRDVLADPLAFGFSNVTDPCLTAREIVCEDPDSYLYWDRRHPTAAAHRHLALLFGDSVQPAGAAVQVQVASVPVPAPLALLLAGVFGLAVAARQRAA